MTSNQTTTNKAKEIVTPIKHRAGMYTFRDSKGRNWTIEKIKYPKCLPVWEVCYTDGDYHNYDDEFRTMADAVAFIQNILDSEVETAPIEVKASSSATDTNNQEIKVNDRIQTKFGIGTVISVEKTHSWSTYKDEITVTVKLDTATEIGVRTTDKLEMVSEDGNFKATVIEPAPVEITTTQNEHPIVIGDYITFRGELGIVTEIVNTPYPSISIKLNSGKVFAFIPQNFVVYAPEMGCEPAPVEITTSDTSVKVGDVICYDNNINAVVKRVDFVTTEFDGRKYIELSCKTTEHNFLFLRFNASEDISDMLVADGCELPPADPTEFEADAAAEILGISILTMNLLIAAHDIRVNIRDGIRWVTVGELKRYAQGSKFFLPDTFIPVYRNQVFSSQA